MIQVSADVKEALHYNQPVVALETVNAFIHGGETNEKKHETTLLYDQAVRAKGALPVLIAIVDGKLKAGLHHEELERIFDGNSSIRKISRRDLPLILGTKQHGAVSVSAATKIADLMGINIVAAGGMGGVHQNAQLTYDISPDIYELATSSVAVVCSGAKSIIDLRLTLEYLETHSVPVLGYQTDVFPSFCVKETEYPIDRRVESSVEVAEILQRKWVLGLQGGVVVANPVPDEFAFSPKEMNDLIQSALLALEQTAVPGKERTNFLLDQVSRFSEGRSTSSNIQLLINNASLAADIAVDYARETNQ
ncbi:hypothetical protein GZ78_09450 [Endozoicomonas numazuensis]|uniref:Pseudouridine-5'-phosphate glycosidase n=2 Tax=Endozoicomonas numazuensis TaxID=1137799 RepID=A0A081NHE1_9GAMM|nr:hypothetical protein GZ78_09450 [Endozoicomonas numazuensis]